MFNYTINICVKFRIHNCLVRISEYKDKKKLENLLKNEMKNF